MTRRFLFGSLVAAAVGFGSIGLVAADRRDRDNGPGRSGAGQKPPGGGGSPRNERPAPKQGPTPSARIAAPKIEAPRRVEAPKIEMKPAQGPRNSPRVEVAPPQNRSRQMAAPIQNTAEPARRGGEGSKITLPGAGPKGDSRKPELPRVGAGGNQSPRRDERGDNPPRGPKVDNNAPKIDLPGRRGNDGPPGTQLPKPNNPPVGLPPAGRGDKPNIPGLRDRDGDQNGPVMKDRDGKPNFPGGGDRGNRPNVPGDRDRDGKPNGPALGDRDGKPSLPGVRDRDGKPNGPTLGDREGKPNIPGVRDRDGKPNGPTLGDRDGKPNFPGLRDRDGKPTGPALGDRDGKPDISGPRDRNDKPGMGGDKIGSRDRGPGFPGGRDRDDDDDARNGLPRLPIRDNDPAGRDGGPGPGNRDHRDFVNRPVKQIRIDPNDRMADHIHDAHASEAFKNMRHARTPDQLKVEFDRLRGSDAVRKDPRFAALNLDRVSGQFQVQLHHRDFDPLVRSRVGQQYHLDRQFPLLARGDVARQMRLNNALLQQGGWHKRHMGPVYARYTNHSFSAWYPGPRWYPRYCWQPVWSPWVRWSFWNTVLPIYDPRPFVVRPIYYDPCPVVVSYAYPVWQPLPVETAGTWVDVPPVVVDAGNDLQLLAVRFVDPGHTEENLGPRFRVWIRNNARQVLQQPIDVTLFASNDRQLASGAVQAGVTIPEIPADTVIPIDIRLPPEVSRMGTDQEGNQVPFQFLHAVVDSRNALPEVDKANNGAILDRGEIFPVDPAAFSTDITAAAPGTVVSLAGEGLGPEPGEVIVTIGDQQLSAEIRGWYDLGVQFTVPNLNVAAASDAQILVIRGDGAASNPVPLSVAPESMIGTLPLPPVPGAAN